ncbi:MAG: Nucleoside-diphosphate-sugar epimerase [Rhodospirillales bacterium]|nr:Nucleoside-diphosphate-sugar epimerase [Rhodospirillales bacterium]
MTSESRTALVTGASGFVGSAVARLLVASGARVRVLMRPGSDRRNIAGLDVESREGSLEDGGSLVAALDGCTELYHVAADYRLWVRDPAAMFRANVDGTRTLMEAALAAGVGRIVYTSSVATLGILPGGVADEATPSRYADMVGPYKQSKFLAEIEVKRLVAQRGLPAVIVNPSTPVGPRDVKPTPTGRIIVEAATGKVPVFVDTGLNLVHVDDVAAAHLVAAEKGKIGERYILGGENLSLGQILTEVAMLSGRKPPTIQLPIGPLFPIALAAELAARFTGKEPFVTRDGLRMARKTMFFSWEKAKRELGYAPRPVRQGLAEALEWFRGAGYLR